MPLSVPFAETNREPSVQMSILDVRVIDVIATESSSGDCVLTITDHLEWGDDAHLLALQQKLNTYLAFIESGEVAEHQNDAFDRSIRIDVVTLHEPDSTGLDFLENAKKVIRSAGFDLRWRQFEE